MSHSIKDYISGLPRRLRIILANAAVANERSELQEAIALVPELGEGRSPQQVFCRTHPENKDSTKIN